MLLFICKAAATGPSDSLAELFLAVFAFKKFFFSKLLRWWWTCYAPGRGNVDGSLESSQHLGCCAAVHCDNVEISSLVPHFTLLKNCLLTSGCC